MASPERRRLEPDQRRAQILACARKLYAERGYESVSTTELARRAGVTRGLINHYFGTKRELYLEVLRELALLPQFAVQRLAHGTLEQRAAASVDRFLSTVDHNRGVWLAAISPDMGQDPDVRRILTETQEITADRLIETLGLAGQPNGRQELRALVRAYSTMATTTAQEWTVRGTLTREQAHTMLSEALVCLVRDIHPRLLNDPPLKASQLQ